MTSTIEIGSIVKGKRCGTFVVMGFRNIDGEVYAQIREVRPGSKTGPEMCLPLSALVAA